jgi:hypothetical protein
LKVYKDIDFFDKKIDKKKSIIFPIFQWDRVLNFDKNRKPIHSSNTESPCERKKHDPYLTMET